MSTRKTTKRKTKRRPQSTKSAKKRRPFRIGWTAAALAVVALLILLAAKGKFLKSRSGDLVAATSLEKPDFQSLVGDWIRPDGGYVIKIRSVDRDGELDAGYFNPRPINVSRAVATAEDGKTNVFVKLQDQGYPGSTYTLVYHEKNDALVGIYYQAVMGQSFDVAFVRK